MPAQEQLNDTIEAALLRRPRLSLPGPALLARVDAALALAEDLARLLARLCQAPGARVADGEADLAAV